MLQIALITLSILGLCGNVNLTPICILVLIKEGLSILADIIKWVKEEKRLLKELKEKE